MFEPTNDDRADWAHEAVNVFALRTFRQSFDTQLAEQGNDPHGDPACTVSDLMANLYHLARRHGWDVEALHMGAFEAFKDEEQEEAEDEAQDDAEEEADAEA